MNNKLIVVSPILAVVFITSYCFSQIPATTDDGQRVILYENGTWQYLKHPKGFTQYLPYSTPSDIIIHHDAYVLSYDTEHYLAKWTIYQITKKQIQMKIAKRKNKFSPDPQLYNYTNLEEDYKNSGYDRGHLVPAADLSFSEKSMEESFYYSNITPQVPSFNRGIWKRLEDQVRKWVMENDTLIIITGPVISDTLNHFGMHNISIPYQYYKIIADFTEPDTKMIGFIIPNKQSDMDLRDYAVSVDSIEKITHIDFFSVLMDDVENVLEKEVAVKKWFIKR